MGALQKIQSIGYENQFSFVCPIFNVSTKLAACMKLRDLVWAGRRVEVRKGCQACMRSSKCPATAILNQVMHATQNIPDNYGSDTPVEGKLRAEILEKILPVIVQDTHTKEVSAVELDLIATANERILKQLATAPHATGKTVHISAASAPAPRKPRAKAETPKPAANSNINHAAATGDLAAAIS